jgi:hypothetical protein
MLHNITERNPKVNVLELNEKARPGHLSHFLEYLKFTGRHQNCATFPLSWEKRASSNNTKKENAQEMSRHYLRVLVDLFFYRRDLAVDSLPSMHCCLNNAWNWGNHSQKCWVDAAEVRRVGHRRTEPEMETFTGTEKLNNNEDRDGWRVIVTLRLVFMIICVISIL